jgi:tetratricopeptide (TPR) repeat protein
VPEPLEKQPLDRVNLALGIFVLLASFVVYYLTVQRTLSFWDCGEFIACSYVLGVPHPPGSPLFVLIGRLFSIFPMAADIGFRVNMLSVISSAVAAMFGYFVVVRLVREWFGKSEDLLPRLGAYVGGVIGALLMAFAKTNWASATEAEVYGLSMLVITFLLWLSLVWAERRGQKGNHKYLVVIAYLGALSIGIHLNAYMVMPIVLLYVLLVDPDLRRNWMFWVTSFVLLVPLTTIANFMYLSAIWAVISGLILLAKGNRRLAALPFFMILAGFMGFSVHAYVPIRAELHPAINENAPSYQDWDRFEDFLDRKQYGQQSMASRMFTRRGTWENQFGTHPRMGFLGFFWDQYGISGKLFLFTLFPLGLFGLGELVFRRWKRGVPFAFLVFAATVGLVLYMNFADGTMQGQMGADDAHLEVRDRDYFWQAGFVLFGLSIGIGFAAIWALLQQALRNAGRSQRLALILLPGLALPAIAVGVNYHELDRSNNFIPYDYAYNILMSADPNAVMFTNGDNDTFPVWCLQEVYGVRKDVRIANLSLLNTDWYGKQLKNDLGVPISLSDAQIEALRPGRYTDGKYARIQDLMIDNIIQNSWDRSGDSLLVPVHFSVTCSESNRVYRGKSMDNYLEMNGMAYRLVTKSGTDLIDIEGTRNLYGNVFQYRGINDPTIYKGDNTARLTNNYGAGFLYSAELIRKSGDKAAALTLSLRAAETLPHQWQNWAYVAQMYADLDSLDQAAEALKMAPDSVDLSQPWTSLAHQFWNKDRKREAYDILRELLTANDNDRNAYQQLLSYYYRDTEFDSLQHLLENWIETHPTDNEAIQALEEAKLLSGEDTVGSGVRVRQVDTVRSDTNQ